MKLIPKTLRFTALVLIPVTIIGALFTYYAISSVSYSEADEYLNFEMQRIQRYYGLYETIPDIYKINRVYSDTVFREAAYRDTTVIDPISGEGIQYREVRFSLQPLSVSDSVITIALRQTLLGPKDIARSTLYIILGILGMFSVSVLVVVNMVAGKIWRPFFHTLSKLRNYHVQESVPEFEKSDIDEFDQLNKTVHRMLIKMSNDYKRTKEFNENAAHELQTQLALIRSAHEELLNTLPPGSEWIHEAGKAHASATKLAHIQKSLLLLSKIGNKEFENTSVLQLSLLVNAALDDFAEVISMRNISVTKLIEPCEQRMDEGLAMVLITNIIKNSVKHNIRDGRINVLLQGDRFEVSNTGEPYEGNPVQLIPRFSSAGQGSLGLGLAIVKQICDLYGFTLTYSIIEDKHTIRVAFPKK